MFERTVGRLNFASQSLPFGLLVSALYSVVLVVGVVTGVFSIVPLAGGVVVQFALVVELVVECVLGSVPLVVLPLAPSVEAPTLLGLPVLG